MQNKQKRQNASNELTRVIYLHALIRVIGETCFILNYYFLVKLSFRIKSNPASWSRGEAFVSGAGGPRFKSQAGQIKHTAANSLPLLQHFFERSRVARRRNDAMGAANSLHA